LRLKNEKLPDSNIGKTGYKKFTTLDAQRIFWTMDTTRLNLRTTDEGGSAHDKMTTNPLGFGPNVQKVPPRIRLTMADCL